MSTLAVNDDAAILERVIQPDEGAVDDQAARYFLSLSFSEEDRARMRELSAKARDGSLSAAETDEINRYERIGHLLSILKSKARRSLKSTSGN